MDSGLIDSSMESMISVVEATVTKDSCPTVKPRGVILAVFRDAILILNEKSISLFT